jgi:hypothetical protein
MLSLLSLSLFSAFSLNSTITHKNTQKNPGRDKILVQIFYIIDLLHFVCGVTERISASCENASSATFLLTLKEEMKLALICHQTKNILFYVLEKLMFVQMLG